MDLGGLLSALNKEMQANALFPSGLGPNRPPASGANANIPLPPSATLAGGGAGAAGASAAAAGAGAGTAGAASANAAIVAAAAATAAASTAGTASPASAAAAANGLAGAATAATAGSTAAAARAASAALATAAAARAGLTTRPTASATSGTGSAASSGASSAHGAATAPGTVAAGINEPAGADIYHTGHTSPSLLAQSGVKAYTQLLSALSEAGHSEKSAEALTNTLLASSATLKSAYDQAFARLPPQLQVKDWRFSVSNGLLVFAQGKDDLSADDLNLLRAAFADSNVETVASELAMAITTMESKRGAGTDMNPLAWGRFRADAGNFEQVVDLRSYLTATAPGSKYGANSNLLAGDGYHPSLNTNSSGNPLGANALLYPEVPLTLGGMYLGDLVTARPDFFKPSVPARTDALEETDPFADSRVSAILHGRCSCGEVGFTLENTLEYAYYCHCSRCRLRTGSAFAAIGGASINKLRVTAGNKHLLIEGECSDGYGARCNRCYAFLFAAVRGRQYVHVSLGALAGTPGRLPDHDIYVSSKAPWYQITDGLPQYDELP